MPYNPRQSTSQVSTVLRVGDQFALRRVPQQLTRGASSVRLVDANEDPRSEEFDWSHSIEFSLLSSFPIAIQEVIYAIGAPIYVIRRMFPPTGQGYLGSPARRSALAAVSEP